MYYCYTRGSCRLFLKIRRHGLVADHASGHGLVGRSCARALLAGFILADIPLAPILLADIILADVLLADIVLATSFSVFSVFDIAQGASAQTLLDSARSLFRRHHFR